MRDLQRPIQRFTGPRRGPFVKRNGLTYLEDSVLVFSCRGVIETTLYSRSGIHTFHLRQQFVFLQAALSLLAPGQQNWMLFRRVVECGRSRFHPAEDIPGTTERGSSRGPSRCRPFAHNALAAVLVYSALRRVHLEQRVRLMSFWLLGLSQRYQPEIPKGLQSWGS